MGVTNKGLVRTNNEDHILIGDIIYGNDSTFNIVSNDIFKFFVFDGVGGNNAGEIASCLAAKLLSENISLNSIDEIIFNLQNINHKIIEKSIEHEEYKNMATTIAGIIIQKNNFFVLNVGDSRVYRYRHEMFHQFSKDHTYYQELLDKGISEDFAIKYKNSHIITKCLGVSLLRPEDISLVHVENGILPGDCFVICSDGVTDMISDDDILDILIDNKSIDTIYEKMVSKVISNGAKDNYSLILIQV